jgi:hypothetical protein
MSAIPDTKILSRDQFFVATTGSGLGKEATNSDIIDLKPK